MRPAVLLLAAALAAAAPWATPAARAATFCDAVGAGRVVGTVADPGLDEISGVVASRTHPGVLWAHEDSGSDPELVALSTAGAVLGRWRVPGVRARDWEDLAAGPGPEPGASYLYVADIGDNRARRDTVAVHRVREPGVDVAGGGTFAAPETFVLRYAGGAVDAETLLVDPSSGDLVVVTKALSGTSRLHVAPAASLRSDAVVDLVAAGAVDVGGLGAALDAVRGRLPNTMVTGGDVAPDGSVVLLRTYGSVLAFPRPPGRPLVEAFRSQPCTAQQRDEDQGEAVAFAADGAAYYTIGEAARAPVHAFAISRAAADAARDAAEEQPASTQPARPRADRWADRVRTAAAAAAIVAATVALFVVIRALVRAGGARARRHRRRPSR